MKKSLLFLVSVIFCGFAQGQSCLDCGTGLDGAYHATTSGTLAGGTYNYSSFIIDAGVVIQATGTQPLLIYVTGDVIINGQLSVNGAPGSDGITYVVGGPGAFGVAGGGNGGDGSFASGAGPIPGMDGTGSGFGTLGDGWSGGGGAGHEAMGLSSGSSFGGYGGNPYGTSSLEPQVYGGSGGGGGSGGYDCGAGGGGAGGGIIGIYSCKNIVIGPTGQITARGGNGGSDGNGNCGGGGGGSGGSVWLATTDSLINDGLIDVSGGIGGASQVPGSPYYGTGADGASGRIRLDYLNYTGLGTTLPNMHYSEAPLSTSVTASQISCFGAADGFIAITPTGGTGGYTYSWFPNITTNPSQNNLPAGWYYITTSDSTCSIEDSVQLTEPTQIVINLTAVNETTSGASDGSVSATVSGGSGVYTYLWNNGGVTDSIGGLSPGTYTLIVTDSSGCSAADSVSITTEDLSVNETPAFAFQVFPNPVTSSQILIQGNFEGDVRILLFNSAGLQLMELNKTTEKTTGLPVDIGTQSAGVYLLQVQTSAGRYAQRLLVLN